MIRDGPHRDQGHVLGAESGDLVLGRDGERLSSIPSQGMGAKEGKKKKEFLFPPFGGNSPVL